MFSYVNEIFTFFVTSGDERVTNKLFNSILRTQIARFIIPENFKTMFFTDF
jgi:hypothetical protein